jgi:calcineurin-like phosphoesterase family protein
VTVWFTSDTHFGHANIIRYSERPYASVAEMDEALAASWNAVVRPGDTIWHLGDFAFRHSRPAGSYLERLQGEKHLVWGNHDDAETRGLRGWASSAPYAELTVEGTRLVLFHYAMRVWNRSHRGAVQLYGHSHNSLAGDSQSCDVGVDNPVWGYRPVSLAEILRFLGTQVERVPVDHHRDDA